MSNCPNFSFFSSQALYTLQKEVSNSVPSWKANNFDWKIIEAKSKVCNFAQGIHSRYVLPIKISKQGFVFREIFLRQGSVRLKSAKRPQNG